MSNASSSSTTGLWEYDVFLSFRGEDTRHVFIGFLYNALVSKGIRTFKDDKKLEIGKLIAPELQEAIETSRSAVVVLSSNFATSKWCLEEIAKVVDCMERGKLTVIPVFYHVTPTDVRHQSNCFQQGFAKHDVDPEITPQKVETWRNAFRKVGDISGIEVKADSDNSEFVDKIVKRIMKEKQNALPTDVPNGLVGIESRVNEVKGILRMESSEVRFIGICGMSGMGKTTLAEAVYKGIQNSFQKYSFIENIKDVSKKNDSTNLCNLQQKLLDDILEENIRVRSVEHGETLLETMLSGLRVLIVLDDVNNVDQLTYLAGSRKWFGPGTRIIITTTNQHVLESHILDEIYTCEQLKGDEALRLFCQSAFKQGHPTRGYEKLSHDIVKLAGGLPLALNVYGSLLCRQNEDYWNGMLKKLQEYSEEKVLGRLEIVYARLDRDQRKTFIYIACFLKGRNIDLVKNILLNIRLQPECAIRDLRNMFLITINHDDSVWVHDLLQQMCWNVLHKESERYDGKLIAIKYRQDVKNILSLEPERTRRIEIINQEPFNFEGDDFYDDHNCFSKMMKLKFLRISKIECHQGLDRLSNELRILEWYGCSLKSLPSMFKPKHIFELEMCYSQLETLWEKDLHLPNLRSINLSFSKDLTNIPDLTSTANLLKLNLEGCTNLTELHESVLLLKRLRYMNLKGCTRLKSLGRSTMEMEALEALILSGCSNLTIIPEFGQNMKHLEHLYVDGTSIKKLPDNLGEIYDLKNLDTSGTSIEELPSSIHHLKKLRRLRVSKCSLSFQSRGFMYTNLDTLSSGIRELELSYCNLSVVPGGIGLLSSLITLNLSGNDFVSLPSSIGLLSKLRMLYLNDCKRLQSLPKLSLVYEDADYGPLSRFKYHLSAAGIDVSKFHATSNNTSPTVSCLNCPKLAENERGRFLAEKVLNNYLQLRSRCWMTPEAVFEIVGAGRKIPSTFKPLSPDETMILEGPWIGVAICAVISLHHIDAYLEAKYVLTVNIHVGDKHGKVAVPINFLVAGLVNHLVLYWTVVDDLQRTLDSKKKKCGVSFDMEPDGNLQVAEFGVQIIRYEDILQLKRREDFTSKLVNKLFQATLRRTQDMQRYIRGCDADTDLNTSHSNIHDLTSSIIKFILDYGSEQDSLDGINKIMKCLIELNQQVNTECKEEWRHAMLFPLVYEYYQISHGISDLYDDFVRLLKDVSDNWMSVKLALKQIVAKSGASDYSYKKMVQQINDLEAAESVRISDDFIKSFAYNCKQTVDFAKHLHEEIQRYKEFKSLNALAKVTSVTVAAVFSIAATYLGDLELLRKMKGITSYSTWKSEVLFDEKIQHVETCYERELWISDFHGQANFLKQLKKTMQPFSCVTKENEKAMTIVIDNLERKIDNFSMTIEDMCNHAHKYSLDISEAVINLNSLIADSNLQATIDLPWYACACGADKDLLHSCHSIVHDHTISIIKLFLDHGKQPDSLYGIHRIFICLHEINQNALIITSDCKEEWRDFIHISQITFKLYCGFVRLLKKVLNSWVSVKLALKQIVVRSRTDDYTYVEMLHQLNHLEAAQFVRTFHGNFNGLFRSICIETVGFLTHHEDIEMENVMAKLSRVTIRCVFSLMATYIGDFKVLQELKDIPSKSKLLDLIKMVSRMGGVWFNEEGELMKRSYGVAELQIWELYSEAIVGELKTKMTLYDCFTQEIEEEMVIVIGKLENNINKFSKTIECMHSDALRSSLFISNCFQKIY